MTLHPFVLLATQSLANLKRLLKWLLGGWNLQGGGGLVPTGQLIARVDPRRDTDHNYCSRQPGRYGKSEPPGRAAQAAKRFKVFDGMARFGN